LIVVSTLLLFHVSCTSQTVFKEEEEITTNPQMEAAAAHLGNILQKQGVMEDVSMMFAIARGLNRENEQIPFDQIFDEDSKLNRLKGKRRPTNGQTFLQAWRETGTGLKDFSSIEDFLISTNLSIYLPYSENFTLQSGGTFTITYPSGSEYESTGYRYGYDQTSIYNRNTVQIDEGYVELNPTLVLMEYYPEDYVLDAFLDTDETPPASSTVTSSLIKQDIDHRQISQNDIVRTYIPKVRLLHQTRGFLGGANRISLYKMSGNFTVGANDIPIGVSNGIQNVGKQDFKISRKSVKDGKWVSFNATFDSDWDVQEATQSLAIITKHFFKDYGVNVELNATVTAKKEKNTWVPSFDDSAAILGVKAMLSLGKNYQKHNVIDLSRREVFSKVVSPDVIHGSVQHDGLTWTVRRSGDVQFFFIHE
jgi:hypothetical protein